MMDPEGIRWREREASNQEGEAFSQQTCRAWPCCTDLPRYRRSRKRQPRRSQPVASEPRQQTEAQGADRGGLQDAKDLGSHQGGLAT